MQYKLTSTILMITLSIAGCDNEATPPTCADWMICYDTCRINYWDIDTNNYAEQMLADPDTTLDTCWNQCSDETGTGPGKFSAIAFGMDSNLVQSIIFDGDSIARSQVAMAITARKSCLEDSE